MSPNKVPQALTEEEWKQWLAGTPLSEEELGPGFTHHSNAATSLYGQIFGFTREDVQRLRDAARYCRDYAHSESGQRMYQDDRSFVSYSEKWLNEIADRIESLLIPEKK